MKKKQQRPGLIQNRRAKFDYELKDRFIAGVILSGAEVSSLRHGHGHLRGAYCTFKNGELWLINSTITPTNSNRTHLIESDQTRARKLLLKEKEIAELIKAKDQGLNIIPVCFQTNKRYIKLEISTASSKKKYDKREIIKKRDLERT